MFFLYPSVVYTAMRGPWAYFHVIGDELILEACVWAPVFYVAERDLRTGIGHQLVGNHASVDRIFTVKINFPIEGELKQVLGSAQGNKSLHFASTDAIGEYRCPHSPKHIEPVDLWELLGVIAPWSYA